jgi:hypothetical protein
VSKIVSFHCNRINVLKYQIESLLNQCEDLEEIIIVNDGLSLDLRKKIREVSLQYPKVVCWDAPINIDHSSPSVAVASLQQWAYDKILNDGLGGKFAFFDGDLFPLKKFKIEDFLKSNSISGILQTRRHVKYLWTGFIFIDFDKLPSPRLVDLNCGVVDCQNVDSTGQLYWHFKKFESSYRVLTHTSHLDFEKLSLLKSCPEDLKKMYDLDYKIEVMEDGFLHYGNSSNWNGSSGNYLERKDEYVTSWLRKVGSIK